MIQAIESFAIVDIDYNHLHSSYKAKAFDASTPIKSRKDGLT